MSIPIFEVQFDKDAQLVVPAQEQNVIDAVTASGGAATDVIVLSHGWNNDMDEARTLYREFLGNLDQNVPAAAGKKLVAIGILWPSKKFADADLIPGGAASAGSDSVPDQPLIDRLQEMKHLFGDEESDKKLDQMKALVPGLPADPAKQNQFVALLGEITDRHLDSSQVSEDEGRAKIGNRNGAALLKSFGLPIVAKVKPGGGGAAGVGLGGNPVLQNNPGGGGTATAAAGIGDFFTGVKAGAIRLLNLTTYLTMKDRAGKVGRDGVNPMLNRIQTHVPGTVKFHLVGHSFGGRLVTAAVDGPNALRVQTLLLLQAAFSHNGFAQKFDQQGSSGFFHAVLDQHKVAGPILITHSKNDRAVGMAYPLASRLNGANAAGLGDANDAFGGMGANGAQHVDRADIVLLGADGVYDFKTPGKMVFNLNGDAIITGHSDVARPETAHVLAAAMM